ncbi:homoserine dehydrogenase [Leptotrichia alba]|uniref:Homoserine dehydrogenase n=1 Tax=Leptotrichia alba TaxID=3239304 RepID=A0AB39V1Y2_9FUSO
MNMKIGIIGLGTVGEGVLKVLTNEKKSIFEKSRADIEVKYACDLNINREFSFDFDKSILTNDYKKILNDPEIKIVVELIGGETIAKQIIIEAFEAKKSVVTANKALIAKYGVELFQRAKENGVSFLFEAAVGGGIPIVTPLMESLVANTVTEIRGIMNGTSNYILTKMKEDNLSFNEALKIASEKGYAEADPTFDVDGIDAGHKINILASLAYGGSVKFKDMQLYGIREISTVDIFSANQLNSTIKLIASSKLLSETSAQISVEPVLIPNSEILAKVDGVYNAIETTGSYTDKTLFYGKGAGMDPTASAVVADIVKIVTRNHIESDYFFNSTKVFEIVDSNTVKDSYYIRVSDDFDIESSPFELINQIENYYIILANDISKNEINEILKEAREKLVLRIMK